jgi:hypothetical protein
MLVIIQKITYTNEFKRLEKQLNQFNLEYCFTEIEKTSWQKATQYKPKYLLGLHKMYKGRPMVYLDADSRILRYPEHRCLERVILNSEYSHFNLPPQYCCIFDHMAEAKNPAILQMQLSRQRKRKRVKPQFI